MEEEGVVFTIGTWVHQNAVGKAQSFQQLTVRGRRSFGGRIAAIRGERETVIRPEDMGVTVLPGAHVMSRCGSANAGCTPSGSGISCAFRVIATIV